MAPESIFTDVINSVHYRWLKIICKNNNRFALLSCCVGLLLASQRNCNLQRASRNKDCVMPTAGVSGANGSSAGTKILQRDRAAPPTARGAGTPIRR
jgi:hypothetical protein